MEPTYPRISNRDRVILNEINDYHRRETRIGYAIYFGGIVLSGVGGYIIGHMLSDHSNPPITSALTEFTSMLLALPIGYSIANKIMQTRRKNRKKIKNMNLENKLEPFIDSKI